MVYLLIFCGRNFCGDRNSLNYTPTNLNNIETLKLQNGIFNNLHATRNANFSGGIPKSATEWNYDTIMLALFENDLLAGNIRYSVDQVTDIRVKIREKGKFNWITIADIPIHSVEDFRFDIYYKYCRAKQDYEVALIPVLDNIEGSININSIHSMFDGLFIVEKDKAYSTLLTANISLQKNKPTNYVQTINRKYPYVFNAGNNDFYTGSVETEFISNNSNLVKNDDINELVKSSPQYREELMDFLTNGNAKILKLYDGRIWMINIINTPSEKSSDIPYLSGISFDWVEIGDTQSTNDLYDNNFIDINIEGV